MIIKFNHSLSTCIHDSLHLYSLTSSSTQVGIRASSFVWGIMLTLIQLPISVLQYLKDIIFPRTPPVRPRPPPLTPPGGGEAAQRVPAFRAEDNDNNRCWVTLNSNTRQCDQIIKIL